MELNKIHHMDCLEGMRRFPDKFFDLVLTDPPYGIGESMKNHQSRGVLAAGIDYGHSEWDSKIPSMEVFEEMRRVSKNQIIFGGNYFVEYLKNSPCWIVWDKDNGENDFSDCELAWTSFSSAVRRLKWRWQGMLQQEPKWKEKKFHPTQKPVPLFRWILEKYSQEGMTVLDPFMGSGTTAVACKQLGRDFIGFEMEPKYVRIANKRLQQETFANGFEKYENKLREAKP